jgi:hypothetical protein
MVKIIRSGSDYVTCRECGEKNVDLNDTSRKELPGGRFQPHCKRCAKKLGREGKTACVSCGSQVRIKSSQIAWHVHPNGEVDPCAVCSQECSLRIVTEGQSNWNNFNKGAQEEPPHSYDELLQNAKQEWEKNKREFSADKWIPTIKTKYIALSAALHISNNYRCEAILDTRLTKPGTDFLPLVITPKYQDADYEYVEQFNRISFKTPFGQATLKIDDEMKHQGFGVTLFNYEITGEEKDTPR